jgi:protein-S-isoprenylcysteine O-methyltransferase Ste14
MTNPLRTIEYMWIVLMVVWVIGRFTAKSVKQRESPVVYIARMVVLLIIFELLFTPYMAFGWLGWRVIPESRLLDEVAVIMAAVGIGLAIWARVVLAGNWSGTVTLKEGHELIRRGPYARIRHPIYTGFALALAGTALAIGQWRGVLALAAVLVAHTMKAFKEEAWLRREFGEAFEAHCRRTGMFLPRLIQRG